MALKTNKMQSKIIDLINEIKDIDFSHISNRNPFTAEEQNEIVCFKIDLLFKNHFPKYSLDKWEKKQ